MHRDNRLFLLAFVLVGSVLCAGQTATGTPPFQSFGGGPFDVVNLGNLNAHFTVPVFNKAGRGVPFTYNLSYDTSVWYPTLVNSVQTWQPVSTYWGWHRDTQATTGTIYYYVTESNCTNPYDGGTYIKTRWHYQTYVDPSGTSHAVGILITDDPCFGSGYAAITKTLTDGSGYTVYADDTSAVVYPKEGGVITPTLNISSGAGNETDKNGNLISVTSAGVFTDTLGTTALTITGVVHPPKLDSRGLGFC